MPLRPEKLKKGWSTFDLPTLPFLAPRIFSSWTSRSCRAPLSTQEALRPTVAYDVVQDLPVSGESIQHSGVIYPRRLRTGNNSRASELQQADGRTEHGLSEKSEEFRRKYEEVWNHQRQENHQEKNQHSSEDIPTRWRIDPRPDVRNSPVRRSNETRSLRDALRKFDHLETDQRMDAAQKYLDEDELRSFKHSEAARNRRKLILLNQGKVEGRRIPQVRPKLVSWKPGGRSVLSSAGLAWQRHFAFLNSRHESFLTHKKQYKLVFGHRYLLPAEFKNILIDHEDSISLRASWESIPASERLKFWPELMYKVLADRPDSALKVLVATYCDPYPPDYAVSDSIDFIISHYFRRPDYRSKDVDAPRILDILFNLLRSGPPDYIHLSQSSIHLLTRNLDLPYAQSLYRTLDDIGHGFHENTLIQFASKFAKTGDIDLAFEILERLQRDGAEFSSGKMVTLCSTLLEYKHRSTSNTRSDDEIFQFMLESGLPPNIIHYNILIQNALRRGYHKIGWQIHDMLKENGIAPDQYTYSILLNDAKIRLDISSIRRIAGYVEAQGLQNAHIATDILHATYLLHQQEQTTARLRSQRGQAPAPTAFEKMLPTYCQYFNIEEISHVIPRYYQQYPRTSDAENERPISHLRRAAGQQKTPVPTLFIMITAFLQGTRSPRVVEEFYDTFRELVQKRDPVVTGLLRTTHIYNAILMAFGRFSQTVPMCPQVVESMLKDASGRPEASDADSSSLSGAPLPDVRTWSILLNIFMLHRQPRAAEKVLELMSCRGIKPNIVTWNSLASGYAQMQDTHMAIDVIERLEQAGLQVDEVTMKGLARIKDRRALIATMRKKEARDLKSKEQADSENIALEALQKTLQLEERMRESLPAEDGTLVVKEIKPERVVKRKKKWDKIQRRWIRVDQDSNDLP